MNEKIVPLQIIENQTKEWVSNYISPDFGFREHQLETISNIVSNIVNENINTHTQIIEAPTGSGKSLIVIISAGVLNKYYKKTSYILCSDLYLWEQYSSFINKHNEINKIFGQLKGQTGNYRCIINNEDMRNADCRIAQIPWKKLFNNKKNNSEDIGYDCSKQCEYVKAREKAVNSKITLMTYQLYFYMINVVMEDVKAKFAPFPKRDIIFCDECHNIPKLVQSQYSPTIKYDHLEKLLLLYKYNQSLFNYNLFAEEFFGKGENEENPNEVEINNLNTYWKNEKALINNFNNLWETMANEKSSEYLNFEAINNYTNLVLSFGSTVNYIDSYLANKKGKKLSILKEEMDIFKIGSWWHNYCCSLNDFRTAINDCGPKYLIKTNSIKNDTKELSVSFNCAKEDYMCFNYLINTSENRVLLSATIGLKNVFDNNLGIRFTQEKSHLIKIPSTFDFSKSPIFYCDKYKMSQLNQENSLINLKPIIYNLLMKNFKEYKGIIQTGSYHLAKEFIKDAPKELKERMLLYDNSSEKENAISIHKKSKNTILVGPSLNEGIDLPEDLCRFIFILKVPYASLGNKLVKAKMELFPDWYMSDASNNIIQGIGRGNRSKNDWCITYIFDGCFGSLYKSTKEQYPKELQNRILFYNVN